MLHRDGPCHEAVMWYVHHLPESMKTPTWWLGTSCCSTRAVKELPQGPQGTTAYTTPPLVS